MSQRISIVVWLAALAGATACVAAESPRPSIVVVLLDDARWDDLGCAGHPFSKTPHIDRVAQEGAYFENAFAVTPLCSPSRASFLTGLYPHAHGIVDNTDRGPASHKLTTFPRLLHDAGYRTGYVGKWHMGVDDSPRPGFDDWLSVKGQGRYLDPELNDNGRVVSARGYVTDLFTERAVQFIRDSAKQARDRPFCLYVAHKAVHPDLEQRADGSISDPTAGAFVPAERHKRLYVDAVVPRRPNCDDTLAGKPALRRKIEGLPPLSRATGTTDEQIRNRLRMLAAVDDGVGRILAALDEIGRSRDTIVVVTSDHGYFYGEHGLSYERRLAYEEAIRIPLVIRYPQRMKPGKRVAAAVLSIDLGPTLLDWAGSSFPQPVHGRSFAPAAEGGAFAGRETFLIEHSSDKVFRRMEHMGYDAVRSARYKFIRYRELPGMDELYDLQADPYELHNLADDPASRKTRDAMEAEWKRLLAERNP